MIYGNTYPVIAVLAALSIGLIVLSFRNIKIPKAVQNVFLILLLLSVAGIIFLIVYFSAIDRETSLRGVLKYLRFDDSWGTHRGFMWIRAVYIYIDLNIIEKIFGTGPDTFKSVMDAYGYNKELMVFKGETTDCAHNVYLNYLVTLGFAGAVSYLTAVVSSIVRCVKNALKNRYALIFGGSVLCYGLQSVVNIDQPITTPLFILMIGILEAENRKMKKLSPA